MNPQYRILHVDDEPAICRAFARTMENAGCEITSVSQADAALCLLKKERFDILASDYRMPGMNGIELLERAREITPNTRRILVSGFCDVEIAIAAINQASIDQLIVKPWNHDELRASIQRVLRIVHLEEEDRCLMEVLIREKRQLLKVNQFLDKLISERTTNLLDSLVCALDMRDTETQWHSRRVAAYARRLGMQFGLTGDSLLDVERGALLHDIGKIGVSDRILLKPSKLTAEEWVEMRRHPSLGYEMLSKIDFLSGARLIVLQHQERWDGKGYPAGLHEQEICIGARIFHIVDTYDAITSDRPYRVAQGYEFARSEIIRCSNTQFDPELVTAWCSIEQSTWRSIREDICRDKSIAISSEN